MLFGKKITVFLIGGTGNNIFQINYANKLISQGFDVEFNTFFLYESWLTKFLGWTIHSPALTEKILAKCRVRDKLTILDFLSILCIKFLSILNIYSLQDYTKNNHFLGRNIGYWQSEFEVRPETQALLKDLFFLKEPLIEGDYAVVHARLGDFSKEQRLDISYYIEAIIKANVVDIYLVTDTPSFIRELEVLLPKDIKLRLGPGETALDDFNILVNSGVLILSNSTFCFWGSQVIPVENVVIPKCLHPGIKWTFDMKNKKIELINN
ncbi:hypothetical protein AB6E23_10595 [Vibrio cyclitrophicus]